MIYKHKTYRPSAVFIELNYTFLSFVEKHASPLDLIFHEGPPFIRDFAGKNVFLTNSKLG